MFASDADFTNLLRAVAITCEEWVDLNDLAHGFSPYGSFVLFRHRALDRALALLPFEMIATASERVSLDPVHEGYVAVLVPGVRQRERGRRIRTRDRPRAATRVAMEPRLVRAQVTHFRCGTWRPGTGRQSPLRTVAAGR